MVTQTTHSVLDTKTKLDCLRVKIAQATSDNGIQLDEEMHVMTQ